MYHIPHRVSLEQAGKKPSLYIELREWRRKLKRRCCRNLHFKPKNFLLYKDISQQFALRNLQDLKKKKKDNFKMVIQIIIIVNIFPFSFVQLSIEKIQQA